MEGSSNRYIPIGWGCAISLRGKLRIGDHLEHETAVQIGTLPKVYSLHHDGKHELTHGHLRSYVSLYLEEEIKQEALVRDLQPFQRFLEVAGQIAGRPVRDAARPR